MTDTAELTVNVPTTSAELVHTRDSRGVHTLCLSNPAGFNVLSDAMLDALLHAIGHVAADEGARVVVITAVGKAFCAGHNLKEMLAQPELAYYQALFAKCGKMMLGLQSLPVPVVAKVKGLATAAGCQLVAQCDLAVSADNVRYGVNGIDVGLFCSTPSVPLSRNIPQKFAMEMLMTGDFITAQQALERGLVNKVVPPDQLDTALQDMVAKLLNRPAEALAMGKQLFYQQRETGLAAAYQLAAQTIACNMMLPVTQEGVRAFTEKRAPSWRQ